MLRPDLILYTQDRQQRFQSFYWEGAESYGIYPQQIVAGQQGWELVNGEEYQAKLSQVFAAGEPLQHECQVLSPRYKLHLHLCLNPVRDTEGEVVAVAVVGRVLGQRPSTWLEGQARLLGRPIPSGTVSRSRRLQLSFCAALATRQVSASCASRR